MRVTDLHDERTSVYRNHNPAEGVSAVPRSLNDIDVLTQLGLTCADAKAE